jgi:acyl-CoA thioester hydrolase
VSSGILIFETAIEEAWIDFNRHLRDAYYGLIASYAADALMDQIGMDAAFREQTGNTLYTVETHMHFLKEVKAPNVIRAFARVLDFDHKRILSAFDLHDGEGNLAAKTEVLLLHVNQGATVSDRPFELKIREKLRQFAAQTAGASPSGPVSRRIELQRKSGQAISRRS